jgi:uncharacterized delta-60 repeat protein
VGGKVVTTFPGEPVAEARGVAVQADGKVVVVGDAASPPQAVVARYNADGTLDSTFGTGGLVRPAAAALFAVVVQADGKILAGGALSEPTPQGGGAFALFRFNADGTPDTAFGTGGEVTTPFDPTRGAEVRALAVGPGGKIVAAGDAGVFLGTVFAVASYNADGTPDAAFGTGGKEELAPPGTPSQGGLSMRPISAANEVAVAANGQIILAGVGGVETLSPEFERFAVARLNADGSLDTTFGSGGWATPTFGDPHESATAVTLLGNGDVLVAGTRGIREGVPPFDYRVSNLALARLLPDGSLDPLFGLGGKVVTGFGDGLDSASALAVQADGKFLVAGTGANDPSESVFALARFFPDGSRDARFGTGGVAAVSFGNPINRAFALAEGPGGTFVEVGATGQPGTAGASDWAVARFLGGNDMLAGSPNQRFVEQAYLDILHRPAEDAGLAFWKGLLDAGVAGRDDVALGIEDSLEGRIQLVQSFYLRYLQRPGQAGEVMAWVGFLLNGLSQEELAAQILGSPEYAQDYPDPVTGERFIRAVYEDVLGREPDAAGLQQWESALAAGASHADVALGVRASQEGHATFVDGLYHRFLHRAAEPAGLELYVGLLIQGLRAENVVAAVVGSEEYFAAAQT